MASWLKKTTNEIKLHHTSELPYLITEKFVLLCDSNMLTEKSIPVDNYLSFYVDRGLIKRQSANYWRLKQFPYRIASSRIFELHNRNKINKELDQERLSVVIIKPVYLEQLKMAQIYDLIERYDKSFLVSKTAESSEKIHTAGAAMNECISCGDSWHVALLKVLDNLCLSKSRHKNWVQNIPDVKLEVYGLKDIKELDRLHDALNDFDISDKIDVIFR